MILFSFVLVGICLGVFLYFILNFFKDDKKAYIYEEAFRFGLEAVSSLNSSATYGKLLSKSILSPEDVNFKGPQNNLIAIKFSSSKLLVPWMSNRTLLKELNLPQSDFLENFADKESVRFVPTPDFKSGFFRVSSETKKEKVILAIYPKPFFEALNSRKYAHVVIYDHLNKVVVYRGENVPTTFDPIPFIHEGDQPKSFDENLDGINFFITSHFSNLSNTSLIVLYDMDSANRTLEILAKTLIWAAVGMFGFAIILSTFFSRTLAKPLELLAEMSREVTSGNMSARVSFVSSDETGILAKSFNTMMDTIQRFIEELKVKARLESELKLASLVQSHFFDLKPIDKPTFRIHGDYIAASECAGDWWTVREWKQKYILLLGDATGHGAASALMTSAVYSAIESMEFEITSQNEWWKRPDEILYKLNRVVNSIGTDIMMTFVAGVYDPETNQIWLSNASHEAPIYYNTNHLPKKVSEVDFLSCTPGPRLGESKTPIYHVSEIQLNSGDRIIFYTDGLTESLVEPGRDYSETFLYRRVVKLGHISIEESVKQLTQVPTDGHPNDDISFFIMEIKS